MLSAAIALIAAAAGPQAKPANPCSGVTTPEAQACAAQHLAKANAEMKRYTAVARDKAATFARSGDWVYAQTLADFDKAEEAWRAYRDAECRSVLDQYGSGTGAPAGEIDCETSLTRLRTHTLWQDWVRAFDGSEMLLEPPLENENAVSAGETSPEQTTGVSPNEPVPPGVTAFVRDRHLTEYRLALTDLNGDGKPEALIYAINTAGGPGKANLCGTGGCELDILSFTADGYRLVSSISIAHPPIRVLPTISHGWHDLAVLVAGGGTIPGYEVRLRFDGRSYPSNPSMPPATHLKGAPGRIVINARPLTMIRAVDGVIAHLDLSSFPNSTGPRRSPGKRSFADYGFTEVELTSEGATLYRPDHSWMMWFSILTTGPSTIRICFGDQGLQRPGDIRAPEYDARSALLLLTRGNDAVTAADPWWQAKEIPGGFSTCQNNPWISG